MPRKLTIYEMIELIDSKEEADIHHFKYQRELYKFLVESGTIQHIKNQDLLYKFIDGELYHSIKTGKFVKDEGLSPLFFPKVWKPSIKENKKINTENKKLFDKEVLKNKKENNYNFYSIPKVLTDLIALRIKEKDFKDYYDCLKNDKEILLYDVMVIFNDANESIFGIYFENEDYDPQIYIPKSENVCVQNL